ncbi:hypothetical protein HMPREF3293_00201, partial [Christensenella minuta]
MKNPNIWRMEHRHRIKRVKNVYGKKKTRLNSGSIWCLVETAG